MSHRVKGSRTGNTLDYVESKAEVFSRFPRCGTKVTMVKGKEVVLDLHFPGSKR